MKMTPGQGRRVTFLLLKELLLLEYCISASGAVFLPVKNGI